MRILTLRNFAGFVLVGLAVFAAVSVWSEVRGSRAKDYGRLYNGELKSADPVTPKLEVVQEASPVADRIGSDPMLLAPAAREKEFLTPQTPAPVAVPIGTPSSVPPIVASASSGDRISISNYGSEGVMVTGEHRLRGGFGR